MVVSPLSVRRVPSLGSAAALFVLLAACETAPPVRVDASFVAAPTYEVRSPANVAVLPVEDGTPSASAQRHLAFLRAEIMRGLVDRLYAPLTAQAVDANVALPPGGQSILVPATLSKLAAGTDQEGTGVFALRVERWDEGRLATERRVAFQFQAALVDRDGSQLWSGSIQGDVKAGGQGAAPLDREAMARSCVSLAVQEMLQRLPQRVVR